MAIEGIQKGHMNLHAKNIALSVGIPAHLVEDAARFMKQRNSFNQETAKQYMESYEL